MNYPCRPGDAREEETLKALGVRNFDVGIVAIGEDLNQIY
jgi:Trk K+ transport system NAD-binding subunit